MLKAVLGQTQSERRCCATGKALLQQAGGAAEERNNYRNESRPQSRRLQRRSRCCAPSGGGGSATVCGALAAVDRCMLCIPHHTSPVVLSKLCAVTARSKHRGQHRRTQPLRVGFRRCLGGSASRAAVHLPPPLADLAQPAGHRLSGAAMQPQESYSSVPTLLCGNLIGSRRQAACWCCRHTNSGRNQIPPGDERRRGGCRPAAVRQ